MGVCRVNWDLPSLVNQQISVALYEEVGPNILLRFCRGGAIPLMYSRKQVQSQ